MRYPEYRQKQITLAKTAISINSAHKEQYNQFALLLLKHYKDVEEATKQTYLLYLSTHDHFYKRKYDELYALERE